MRLGTRPLSICVGIALSLSCGSDVPSEPGSTPPPPPPPPDPAVASVSIDPGSIAFGALGSSRMLTATARNAAGDVIDTVVSWAVVGSGVARVEASGLLVSLGNGTDTVTASAGNVTGSAAVTVQQVAAAVAIGPYTATISIVGTRAPLSASTVDSQGFDVPGPPITWSSTDTTVLPVSLTGEIVAAGLGTATIVATDGTFADSAEISVSVSGPAGGPIVGQLARCVGGRVGGFPCAGIDVLAYLPVPALGGTPGITVTDAWGWTDPVTGVEWAIVQRTDATVFVDLSDPLNPRYRGELPRTAGTFAAVWRDVKVYADHAFIVADGAGQAGMQVFDLRQLRDVGAVPQVFDETARYTGVGSAHNIVINTETGYAYVVGSNGGDAPCGVGLHMIDIRVPQAPVGLGCFVDPFTGNARTGYTHDAQCVLYQGPDPDHQGSEICFGLNETALSVADVTDKTNPVAISRAEYPNVAYAHQGWLTEDQRYFYSNDELDELGGGTNFTRLLIWDVSDLDDPVLVDEYMGPSQAIDHNLYVRGDTLFHSNYQYGIRLLDISDPVNPVEIGHFDTAPNQPDVPGFGGSWSNYPFYASGIVIVTSGAEGLFVLRAAD